MTKEFKRHALFHLLPLCLGIINSIHAYSRLVNDRSMKYVVLATAILWFVLFALYYFNQTMIRITSENFHYLESFWKRYHKKLPLSEIGSIELPNNLWEGNMITIYTKQQKAVKIPLRFIRKKDRAELLSTLTDLKQTLS